MVMFVLVIYALFKDNMQIAIELFDNTIEFLDISGITFYIILDYNSNYVERTFYLQLCPD